MTRTRMTNKVWEQLSLFYDKKFGISSEILEFMADRSIIQFFLYGLSNEDISNFTEIEVDDIKETIYNFCGLTGFESRRRFNYYDLFQKCDEDFDEYCCLVYENNPDLGKIFNACRKYNLMQERVEKEDV